MTAPNDPLATSSSESQPSAPDALAQSVTATTPIQPVPPPPPGAPASPPEPKRVHQPMTSEELGTESARLDKALIPIVLVLAFFLASFTAHNADFWMNLATGRLIVKGEYRFGPDPFSYTTDPNQTWVNQAWLSDVAFYLLSGAGDGEELAWNGLPLVLVKALLITALAWVMLSIRRPGQSTWAPAGCTLLAVLAMSPRLLLQTPCISFLFLGLTLYILFRPSLREPAGAADAAPRSYTIYWLLPPLFALWVNLDSWFLIGPMTVALYLVGEAIHRRLFPTPAGKEAPDSGQLRTLTLVLVVGLAACLLNPYGVKAFTLPVELWAITTAPPSFRRDEMFKVYFYSPLVTSGLVPQPGSGEVHVAGLAFFPLLLLSLVSFALHRDLRGGRGLIWLVFALLALYMARLVPFFAVVAGPITALNLQEYADRRYGSAFRVDGRWKEWSLGGRFATLLAGLVLLAAAWPGWLHENPNNAQFSRHVAWKVAPESSLRRACHNLADLRRRGILTENARGFNFHPEIAAYSAWFCPQEKCFLDFRFPLYGEALAKFLVVRRVLNHKEGDTEVDASVVAQVFTDYGIDHLMFSRSSQHVARRLRRDQNQWPLLYLDGRSTVLGWINPQTSSGPQRFQGQLFDPNRMAFAPDPAPDARAPANGPDLAQSQSFWSLYLQGPSALPLDTDEAYVFVEYFTDISVRWGKFYAADHFMATCGEMTGQPFAFPRGALLPLWYMLSGPGFQTMNTPDQGPPGAPLLAVRAARRAIAADPELAESYVALGQAYFCLWKNQESRWSRAAHRLQELRQVQIVFAFQQALVLRPDYDVPHRMLADVFRDMGALDLAVDHYKDYLKTTRAAGPRTGTGEKPLDFKRRLDDEEGQLKNLEESLALKKRRDDYELNAANKPYQVKVEQALARGLVGQAIKILRETDPTQVGRGEGSMLLRLLLTTGNLEDAQKLENIPDPWSNFLMEAALGKYRDADARLDAIIQRTRAGITEQFLRLAQRQMLLFPTEDSFVALNKTVGSVRDTVDLGVLRGLLALEEGDNVKAAGLFREALNMSLSPQYVALFLCPFGATNVADLTSLLYGGNQSNLGQYFIFETRPVAFRYLRLLEAESAKKQQVAAKE